MTNPDYRALCARMADELDHYRQLLMDDRRETHALATEARAALAQPKPVAPTDEEILSLADDCGLDHDWECTAEEILTFARTIQQRSTPSAIEPVPQQEAV